MTPPRPGEPPAPVRWPLRFKLLALFVLLAGVPLLVAFGLSTALFERSLGAGLNPTTAAALEDAVAVFGERVAAEKARHRALAAGLADGARLQRALVAGDTGTAGRLLDAALREPGIERLVVDGGAMPPIERTRPAELAHPLRETLALRLPDETGYRTLHYTYVFDGDLLERFERMGAEVISPFNALEADRDRRASVYAWSFVATLAATMLAVGAIALVGGGRIARRITRLRAAMGQVAAGDFDARVEPSGHDEVADLAQGFNDMARQLAEGRARIEYLTQISAWQGIARRMAHEIKNPLTPILLSVQQAESAYGGEDAAHRRTLALMRRIVEQEVGTLRRLVDAFSQFAQLPALRRAPCDVAALCRDAVRAHADIPGLTCAVEADTLPALVDEGLLRQAVTNLLLNAHQAVSAPTSAGRAAPPSIRLLAEAEAGLLTLSVVDNGPGVPADRRAAIFEPYVTGRPDGTGLGLAIVKRIAVDHGGTVEVDEAPGGGARFRLVLPCETGAAPGGSMPLGALPAHTATPPTSPARPDDAELHRRPAADRPELPGARDGRR